MNLRSGRTEKKDCSAARGRKKDKFCNRPSEGWGGHQTLRTLKGKTIDDKKNDGQAAGGRVREDDVGRFQRAPGGVVKVFGELGEITN